MRRSGTSVRRTPARIPALASAVVTLAALLWPTAAASASPSALAADPPFGTQTTIGLYAPVPAGWAAVAQNQATGLKTIEFLGGAPYLARVAVLANTTVPAGWVLVAVSTDARTSQVAYLGGAPHGATVTADVGCTMPGGRVYGYPVPAGWTIVGSGVNSVCSYQNLRYP
ncbi:hypothetical protein ACFYUY_21315 [Kitasatospora sp. NPDC004745]|uniref:hypothetical protein n=1 Tax=Kitasatospora sp. NPDC004745 TaxID=3364019 RepID=UPI0036C26C8E